MPKTRSFQNLIIEILECSGFQISAQLVCHQKTRILIGCTRCHGIVLLNHFPLLQLTCNIGNQWNRANRVFRFWLLNHDFSRIAHTIIIHFGQTIQRTTNRQHSLAKVNVFPTKTKQFPQTNPCCKRQANENTVPVFVAGIDKLLLFFTSENLNLRLFIAWQTNRITGIEINIMLQYCLIHRFVQTSMKIQNGFWRKSLRILLIVIEVLQQFCGKIFQLERGECWCKVIFNVSSITNISRLLDFVFHVGFQPKPQPIKKSGGCGVNVFLKVNLVLFFVQLLNRLCLCFSIVRDSF